MNWTSIVLRSVLTKQGFSKNWISSPFQSWLMFLSFMKVWKGKSAVSNQQSLTCEVSSHPESDFASLIRELYGTQIISAFPLGLPNLLKSSPFTHHCAPRISGLAFSSFIFHYYSAHHPLSPSPIIPITRTSCPHRFPLVKFVTTKGSIYCCYWKLIKCKWLYLSDNENKVV